MARNLYGNVKRDVLAALEELPRVKAPLAEYLAALKDLRDEVDNWFEASIEAAQDDVKRQGGE